MKLLEWLLRVATPRNFAVAGVILAILALASYLDLYQYVVQWNEARLYPPQKASGLAGREILQSKQQREAATVARRYDRIMAGLEAAGREGFVVAPLAAKARAALKFNVPDYRIYATRLLIQVEMAIPRKRTRAIPASESDETLETPASIPAKKTVLLRRGS